MAIEDCSCNGINPNCEKCDGRGYYNTNELLNIPKIGFKYKYTPTKDSFTEKISNFSAKAVDNLISKKYNRLTRDINYLNSADNTKLEPFILLSTTRHHKSKYRERLGQLAKDNRTRKSIEFDILNIKIELEILFNRAVSLNIQIEKDKYPNYFQ
jgi:hypothetical protein